MLNVLVTVVLVALSALLARAAVRGVRFEPRSGKGRLVFWLVFGAIYLATRIVLQPSLTRAQLGREVDEAIASDPLYARLLADHPELRDPLRSGLMRALQSPEPAEASTLVVAEVLSPVFEEYLPKASDAALVSYASAMASVLRRLQADGPRCYALLFPAPGRTATISRADGGDELTAAFRLVVTTASAAAPAVPTEEAIDPILGKVMAPLSAKYGADVALLDPSGRPDADPARVCAVFTDLFEEIGRLPDPERAPVIRYLVD